jgi:Fic family protein
MTQYIWQREDWPQFSWDTGKLLVPLGECRLAQGRLISRVASLGVTLGQEAQAEILVEETLKTSAIEGEQLAPRSVRLSVARRLGIPTAGLPVDSRIDDLVSVLLDATQNCESSLPAERLWGWQAALFPSGYSGMHKIRVGNWREGGDRRHVPVTHRPLRPAPQSRAPRGPAIWSPAALRAAPQSTRITRFRLTFPGKRTSGARFGAASRRARRIWPPHGS